MKALAIILVVGMGLTVGCSNDGNDNNPTGTGNHAPVIQSITASPQEVSHNRSAALNCIATDADRDTLTYAWSTQFGSISADGAEASWRAPEDAGTYYVKVIVNDGVALDVDSVQVTVAENRPPVIESLTAGSSQITHGGSTTITCFASDADDDDLGYYWTPSTGTISGLGENVQWRAPHIAGSYWIYLEVKDGFESTFDSIQVTVLANRAPVIQSVTANPIQIEHGERSTISCIASDTDNDALAYTWNSQSGSISGSGSGIQWTAPNASGSFWVTVGVNDGVASVRDTAIVTVVPPNSPPADPFDPRPGNIARNVAPESVEFSWRSVDPDGDPITYDFYFGANLSLIQRDLNTASFRMDGLNANTTYYWGIMARDNRGGVSRRTFWEFRTQ